MICEICSGLKDYECGMQKHAYEDEDTFLPKIFSRLKFVRDIRPGKTRTPELLQCPDCGTYYVYQVTYEYLATGSEDGQELTRLKSIDDIEKFI